MINNVRFADKICPWVSIMVKLVKFGVCLTK